MLEVSSRGDRFARGRSAGATIDAAGVIARGRLTPLPRATTVAVFATHRLEAEALASVLGGADDLEVACAASDLATLTAAVAVDAPDVVLLAARVDEAVAIATRVRARAPGVSVVVVTEPADAALAAGAAAAGIEAVVPKDSAVTAMVMAIHQVAAGSTVYPAMRSAATNRLRSVSGVRALSGRQREVLRLLAEGRSNTEIADALFISVNTVKFHLRSIFRELGLRNRVQAAQRYAEHAARSGD
jgi:DNA-binding NarL/FixJ family response regulator